MWCQDSHVFSTLLKDSSLKEGPADGVQGAATLWGHAAGDVDLGVTSTEAATQAGRFRESDERAVWSLEERAVS